MPSCGSVVGKDYIRSSSIEMAKTRKTNCRRWNHGDQNKEPIEIPSLVVEIFMEWLENVELLKTCRLVDKYWNRLACSSLQINSIAKIDKENKRLEEFLEFLKPKSSRELSLHPSPFKNVHITICERKDRCIDDDYWQLFENPNIKITSLDISFLNIEIYKLGILNQILKATMADLVNLTISQFRCGYLDRVFQDVKLPALTSLSLVKCYHMDRTDGFYCFEPLKTTLENARLQQCTSSLTVQLSSCVYSLLTINLSWIVELTLKDIHKNNTFWNDLPMLQLPALKSLSFNSTLRQGWGFAKGREFEINSFLNNVASTLIKLDICYGSPLPNSRLRFREIVFPKLKYLFLTYPEDICTCFTSARFPSLQTLHLCVSDVVQIQVADESDPLESVRVLDIFFNIEEEDEEDDLEEDEVDVDLPIPMLNLARKFPNVESFGASAFQYKYSLSLLDRHQAYPNLKCLRQPNSNDFTAPPGTSEKEVEEYKRAGQLIEKIAYKPIGFDFKTFECRNCK